MTRTMGTVVIMFVSMPLILVAAAPLVLSVVTMLGLFTHPAMLFP